MTRQTHKEYICLVEGHFHPPTLPLLEEEEEEDAGGMLGIAPIKTKRKVTHPPTSPTHPPTHLLPIH